MAPTPPIPEVLVFIPNSTVGAVEIGMLLGAFLFGLVTCQTYVYYQRFPRDTLFNKLLVGFIWVLELGHTIANSNYLYFMTILNYSNPVGVITAPASLGVGIMCSAFIGPVVQAWFAYRVLKFSGSFYIPVACWFLSALRCASTISVAIEALQGGEVRAFEETYRWLLIFILAVGAAVDILIAASLCYYFRKHSRAGGVFAKTMNQLMIWTIETGLLTSVTAVSMLVCFLTMQDNYVWIAIFTFLAKLFSNTFLAALNARSDKRPETALIEKSHLNKSNMSISSFGSPSTYSTPFTTPARSLASPRRTYAPLRKPSLTIQMSYSTDVSYEERTIYDRPVSERWLLSTSPRLPDSPISPTGIAY